MQFLLLLRLCRKASTAFTQQQKQTTTKKHRRKKGKHFGSIRLWRAEQKNRRKIPNHIITVVRTLAVSLSQTHTEIQSKFLSTFTRSMSVNFILCHIPCSPPLLSSLRWRSQAIATAVSTRFSVEFCHLSFVGMQAVVAFYYYCHSSFFLSLFFFFVRCCFDAFVSSLGNSQFMTVHSALVRIECVCGIARSYISFDRNLSKSNTNTQATNEWHSHNLVTRYIHPDGAYFNPK